MASSGKSRAGSEKPGSGKGKVRVHRTAATFQPHLSLGTTTFDAAIFRPRPACEPPPTEHRKDPGNHGRSRS